MEHIDVQADQLYVPRFAILRRVPLTGLGSSNLTLSFPLNEEARLERNEYATARINRSVSSINGATGDITLDTDDIPEGSTNLYWEEAPVDGSEYVRKDGDWAVSSSAAGDLIDPMTTRGDIIIRGETEPIRLGIGTAKTVLMSDGTDPSWQPTFYVHTQTASLTTWNITHNLGKRVDVKIYDDDENVIEAHEKYIDDNNLRLTFSVSMTGKAIIT